MKEKLPRSRHFNCDSPRYGQSIGQLSNTSARPWTWEGCMHAYEAPLQHLYAAARDHQTTKLLNLLLKYHDILEKNCSILRFVTSAISHHTRRQEWKAQGGVCPGYLADSARDDRCLGKDPTHAPSHTRRLTVLAFIIPAILPNVVASIATPLCKKMMLGGCVVPILNVAAGSSTLHSLYPLYSSTILQSQSKRSRGKPRRR